MKGLSLAAIGMGVLCLIVAVAEKFVGMSLLRVQPVNYVHLASAFFLLSVTVTFHCKYYGSKDTQK